MKQVPNGRRDGPRIVRPLAVRKDPHATSIRSPGHLNYRTRDGESIVEHIAGVDDYQIAVATFRAACAAGACRPAPRREDNEPPSHPSENEPNSAEITAIIGYWIGGMRC